MTLASNVSPTLTMGVRSTFGSFVYSLRVIIPSAFVQSSFLTFFETSSMILFGVEAPAVIPTLLTDLILS